MIRNMWYAVLESREVKRSGVSVPALQDRRVVHTRLPRRTEYKMNENLLQGGGPVIAYRKRRDLLKKNN